ncbi:MAG: TIM barrel protein, partial [Candidatus Lokiarchaeota archaeon]|nr:TIM barrel protein [Candidatus Lokiarchaeota archaeon]
FEQITIERFQILRQLAKKYEFRVGFEPLGFPNCSVRKVNKSLDIIKESEKDGLPPSGLIIDTFHFFLAEHTSKDLLNIPEDRLWLVHVNDSVEKPLNVLQDSDRVWLGEGFFQLDDFFKNLKSTGYDDYISIELFNEDYWKLSPQEVAETALNSIKKYF